jgi:hypothetical protein
MARSTGVKLVSRDGHSHWADPTMREVVTDEVQGWAWGVECDLGGVRMTHWLAPDGHRPGQYTWLNTPAVWPTIVEAERALAAYRQQQEGGRDG